MMTIGKITGGVKDIVREANFLSLTGNVAISFFGFAGFALLARDYDMDIFGEWVLFISMAAFIDMFRFGIVTTAIVRYLSGSGEEERKQYIGSFILIIFLVTLGISALVWVADGLFPGPIREAGYGLFFTWYPFIAFINIPMYAAMVIMQADLRFDRILLVNSLYSILFFGVILSSFLFFHLPLTQIVWAQFLSYFVVSLFCIVMGWDGIRHLFRATRKTNRTLIDFGKYTTLTLIGTNLLRSADTFIISLSPMGPAAVALYSIPMKLTEIQQIPLRSFAATAFPKMSKQSIQGNVDKVKDLFYTYSGAMSYLFAFISLCSFIFADFFVLVVGGSKYTGTEAATIVRIFSVYGLLLPLERMTGIGLDSINKPNRNFQKVLVMVITNIIGDLIAVFIFQSLAAVAIASVLFTLIGVWIGYYFLDRQIELERGRVFSSGLEFYKTMFCKVRAFTRQNI
jgi:O-antigen/teichoic acid export membrane protein